MKCYLTTLLDNIDLVPYFVPYYAKLGATCFPVLTYGSQACHEEVLKYIRDLGLDVESVGVLDPNTFHARPQDRHVIDTREKVVAAHVGNCKDWVLYPDMDEFAECTREQLESAMKVARFGYVGGAWLDRVARGGKLVAVQPGVPLEETFPLGGQVRRIMGLKNTPPVYIASRFPPTAHHPSSCAIGQKTWRRTRPIFRVHHFKWQANCWSRMVDRRRVIKNLLKDRDEKPRLGGVNQTLAHFRKNKGINPKKLRMIGNRLGV